jgi:cell division septal protein FtsQ
MTLKSKILSVGLLSVLSAALLILSFGMERNGALEFDEIDITGNIYQSNIQYSKFAKLDECIENNLSLQIIKNRLEKHPYVKFADVIYESGNKLKVNIHEKEFVAILVNRSKQYILTEDFEALPVIGEVHNSDYPLVCNLNFDKSERDILVLENNSDLRMAFKILKSIEILNPEMFAQISEIDLCNGKTIAVYFNNFEYPIVVGKKNEIRKIVYLNKLWTHLNGKKVNKLIKYINLEFNNMIYLGMSDDFAVDKKEKS